MALDVLHGVVVYAAVAADGMDVDYVGVVERGGRPGLVLEALEAAGVECGGEGDDLQGHPAVERGLLGLVDHAHPAAADLAEDAVLAHHSIGSGRGVFSGRPSGRVCAGSAAIFSGRGQGGQKLQGGQEFFEFPGMVRVLGGIGPQIDRLACLQPPGDFVDQIDQDEVGGLFLAGCEGHLDSPGDSSPKRRRKR